MPKSKNAICRGCGTSYQKNQGISGRYCSNLCKVKYPKRRKKCNPCCHHSHLEVKEVTFKNGIKHLRQSCKLCVFFKYIPKEAKEVESKSLGFIQAAKEVQKTYGDSFYTSVRWMKLRYETLKKYGRICQLCSESNGKMHVDHIKPRSKYPELELDPNNLQVLCEACNLGKGNWDETDWRK